MLKLQQDNGDLWIRKIDVGKLLNLSKMSAKDLKNKDRKKPSRNNIR